MLKYPLVSIWNLELGISGTKLNVKIINEPKENERKFFMGVKKGKYAEFAAPRSPVQTQIWQPTHLRDTLKTEREGDNCIYFRAVISNLSKIVWVPRVGFAPVSQKKGSLNFHYTGHCIKHLLHSLFFDHQALSHHFFLRLDLETFVQSLGRNRGTDKLGKVF